MAILRRRGQLLHTVLPFLVSVVVMSGMGCSARDSPVQAPAPTSWPTEGWRNSTPEEQRFDSAKLAEGLQAMRENNINIH